MNVISFEVEELFGRKGTISISLKDSATIVFGINGSGKTTVLKLLNSMLTGCLFEILNVSFKSLSLNLSNGKTIKATRVQSMKKRRQGTFPYAIKLELLDTNSNVVHSSNININKYIELSERIPLNMIEHVIPELNRVNRREWIDITTNNILSFNSVLEKYSDQLPWAQPNIDIDWYRTLIEKLHVKFIQTQRLIIMKAEPNNYNHRSGLQYQNAVIDRSGRLRTLIRDKLNESINLSQNLDSTYPRRLLLKTGKRLTDTQLKQLLDETECLGDKLRKVDLLTAGGNFDIRLESIGENNRQAISLYLSDSAEKYQALEPFADKLLLFLDIINRKFKPTKTVKVDGQTGIHIGLANGDELHPNLLSSGEQHEIVLLLDLIFFSSPGTLVLIDEPEISLHIDWQREFLSDVEAIGKAAGLKFVLATHSPAIIGNRVDICQEI